MNVLRQVPDLWRRLDVTIRDLPLPLLLILLTFLPVFDGQETYVGELPERPFDAVAVVVLALLCLPLAGRRRWPAATSRSSRSASRHPCSPATTWSPGPRCRSR